MHKFSDINSFSLCTTASLQCFDRENNILSQTHYYYCGLSIASLFIDSTLEQHSGIVFLVTLHSPFRGIIHGETLPEETLKFKTESQRETQRVEGIVMH